MQKNFEFMRKEKQTGVAFTTQDAKDVLRKVVADKQRIQSYVSVHGNLRGFSDETVVFAKPL